MQVVTAGTDDSVCWEAPPAGFLPAGPDSRPPAAALMEYNDSASAAVLLPAAPDPIPYGGGGIRLAAKVQARLGQAQQQLQCFLHGIAEGLQRWQAGPAPRPRLKRWLTARVHRYHLPAWLSARTRYCVRQRVQKAGCRM